MNLLRYLSMFRRELGGATYTVHSAREYATYRRGVQRTHNDRHTNTQYIKVCRRARDSQYQPSEPGYQYDRANKGKQPAPPVRQYKIIYLSSSFPFVRGEVLPATFSSPHLIVFAIGRGITKSGQLHISTTVNGQL